MDQELSFYDHYKPLNNDLIMKIKRILNIEVNKE